MDETQDQMERCRIEETWLAIESSNGAFLGQNAMRGILF